MAKLTENGIVIERLDRIIETLEQGFKQIYGQNINLAPDTPDGQMIGILAQMKMDIEELAENIYKQLDPNLASGAWLEQRVAYAGLVRRQASYSYLRSVILSGEPNAQLPAGIVCTDPNKVRWVLVQNVRLNEQGSIRADFRSEELGAFSLPENVNLTVETVTLGLETIVTTEAAQIGEDEESDPELRQRFFLSRSQNSHSSIDAMHSAIANLPDVKNVVILENMHDYPDDNNVPAHSLNVIVEGGDNTAIARAIVEHKGAGTGLMGSTEVTLNVAGAEQIYRFDRAANVDVAVYLNIVRDLDGTEIDKEALKSMLTSKSFLIGKSVSLSRLYTPINKLEGFWVRELKIGRVGDVLKAENIELTPREKARILAQNITIEIE